MQSETIFVIQIKEWIVVALLFSMFVHLVYTAYLHTLTLTP